MSSVNGYFCSREKRVFSVRSSGLRVGTDFIDVTASSIQRRNFENNQDVKKSMVGLQQSTLGSSQVIQFNQRGNGVLHEIFQRFEPYALEGNRAKQC